MPELSGLNVDYQSLAIEMQEKMAKESDLLSVGFPDQTIVLLSNTLAGITAMLNYSQVTANLNNFFPFAFLKTAGYAISATLGVSPRRKTASEMWIRLRPPGGALNFSGQMDSDITIPAYTQFLCRDKYWHTRQVYTLNNTDPYLEIQVHEGKVLMESFVGLGEKYQRWFVGTQFSVDNNTVRVMVDEDWWDEAEEGSFVYYGPANTVFLQQTAPDGKVLIFFGNGIYGRVPPRGADVRIYYTETTGFLGNSASIGDEVGLLDAIEIGPGQILSVDAITTTIASGGEDEHSLDDLKYVIPRLYAANQRAVRRDDYIGHLLGAKAPLAFADARVWGEYEQANKEGIGKLEMMNRSYWTGILRTFYPTKLEGFQTAIGGGQSTFSFTLPVESIIKGSLHIVNTENDIVFNDSQGHGVIVSPDVGAQALTGGTITASSTAGGSNDDNMVDTNIETNWQSATTPTPAEPITVIYDLGVGESTVPKAMRIRASNDSSREQRAFPKFVSLWGTNITPPDPESDEDWEPIRGRMELYDPGIANWSPWMTFENETGYRYVKMKIEDRYGSQGFVKICEWQVMSLIDASTIDYNTMEVVVKYPFFLAGGHVLDVDFYGPDLSPNQISEVDVFLRKYNHFTTLITYKPPIMRRLEVEVEIHYFSEYDGNEIFSNVEDKLNELFALKKGSIGRKISHSDLVRTVLGVEGVDYATFLSPPLGSDIIADLGEFIFNVNNRINMYISERSQQFNRYGIDK